ncbi:RhoGAP domain-containing protein [Heterostelium album PN500]|uniref:RhoGAP domain-containing protein n=1 Tax=Heterostelium pallidum (strain ATCC 26659 / Pp 5 / PN500) TaxID=670386 RepID=D3BBN7_HETP5|nr:RhoGAP domain-containing protein [Heterostelium album PN500]EFA81070.1 RhoGAP domain-containing protein [Heterostelium album PN500]|eukprot:XP_020433188.1 RhoGAP domain-containing protein [Heterostelium album PN500]
MEEPMVWAGSEDKTIFVIDPRTLNIINTINHPEMLMINSLKSIANSIWSCSRDSSIRMWDPRTYECKGVLDQYHTDAVTDAVFCFNSRKVRWEFWSASYDKSICIWVVSSDSLQPPPPNISV